METKEIHFVSNWNEKLNGKAFTTIRLYNPQKYRRGDVFNIYLNNVFKGRARIVDEKKVKLDNLNEWITLLDTGYGLLEFRALMKRMYKNKVQNWDAQYMHFLLLKYD